jgi:hypothetical protein
VWPPIPIFKATCGFHYQSIKGPSGRPRFLHGNISRISAHIGADPTVVIPTAKPSGARINGEIAPNIQNRGFCWY